MTIEIYAPPEGEVLASKERSIFSSPVSRICICLALAVLALLIHGYHPYAVDGSIYVPAIKKQLNPELYPRDAQFFQFPTQLSMFSRLMAGSVRLTSLPLQYVLLLWQALGIAVFLGACWRLGRICFRREREALYGALLMASVLTVPVAGTSLMLFDPYLTSRSLSTPALLMAVCCVLERKLGRAGLWLVAAGLVHPLMAAFGAGFMVTLFAVRSRNWRLLAGIGAVSTFVLLMTMLWALGAQITPAYRAAVLTRSYFFLSRWEWYEIFGLIAPLVLFGVMLWYRREVADRDLQAILLAAILYGTFFLLVGVMIDRTPELLPMAKFQPLRAFHLLYALLFLLPVTAFVVRMTRSKPAIAILLLIGTSGLMYFVQEQTFPASAHVEWPWSHGGNKWVQAFDWVRHNTPKNALFALDARYTETPGEDCQGFSALAERSALPDISKDGGVAALFPNIADEWERESQLSQTIRGTDGSQVRALADAGASWIVLRRGEAGDLACPYENSAVAVCRLPAADGSVMADHSNREALPRGALLP